MIEVNGIGLCFFLVFVGGIDKYGGVGNGKWNIGRKRLGKFREFVKNEEKGINEEICY